MTNAELLEAGMTTVSNSRVPDGLRGPQVLQLEAYWYQEHKALMDYNAESGSKATYSNLRNCRLVLVDYERRLRP